VLLIFVNPRGGIDKASFDGLAIILKVGVPQQDIVNRSESSARWCFQLEAYVVLFLEN
jgi:hypothetical protein